MPRDTLQEVADLTVRLMDSGLPESSARKEAERITNVIANEAYRRGYEACRSRVLDSMGAVTV